VDSRGRDCRVNCWFDQIALGGQIEHRNILQPATFEGAELGTGHPNILCLAELQEACKTATCRAVDLAASRARICKSGRFPGHSRSSDPEKAQQRVSQGLFFR